MPMTAIEAEALFAELGLDPLAADYVRSVRRSPPSRRVRSTGMRNTPWRYPSQKMGFTISGESGEEKCFAAMCEFDDNVIEYWDQPIDVDLSMTCRNGQQRRVSYHPDFLVIRRSKIDVIQVKTIGWCLDHVTSNPNRWRKIEDHFEDIPAKELFEQIGLRHEVVTSSSLSEVSVENSSLLLRAMEMPRPSDYAKQTKSALQQLGNCGGQTVSDLLAGLRNEDATLVLQMIADGMIVADLDKRRLSSPHDCWVAANQHDLQTCLSALSEIPFPSRASAARKASMKELGEALDRLRQARGEAQQTASPRTIRRWRRTLDKFGNDPSSLIPCKGMRGNRHPRISGQEARILEAAVKKHFLNPVPLTISAAYLQYAEDHRNAVQSRELPACSAPISSLTFRKHCMAKDPEAAGRARGGTRLANAMAAPVPPEYKSLTPLRPFERGHVDHYECDLHVVVTVENGERVTQRPWLTALRDQSTGAILGISLSFRSPSRRSCSNVIRDCVRRHQRLPETIVVDNGKEFDSTYFEMLLAQYGIAKQSRPPGAPRFGATIESAFKSLRQYLHSLPGSTANDTRGRSISPSHRGQRLASLDIFDAYAAIDSFLFGHFNNTPLPGSLSSPNVLLSEGLRAYSCSGILAPFDEALLAETAPPLDRRLRFDRQRGLRHLDRWFYAPELLGLRDRQSVEVYEEPWDRNRIYALIRGKLITCFSGATRSLIAGGNNHHMLTSILHIECSEVRGRIAKARAASLGRETRNVTGSDASRAARPQSRQTRESRLLGLLPESSTVPTPYDTEGE